MKKQQTDGPFSFNRSDGVDGEREQAEARRLAISKRAGSSQQQEKPRQTTSRPQAMSRRNFGRLKW